MMIDQFRVSNPYNSTAIAVVATAAAAAAESQGSRGKEEIRTRAKATEKERKRNTHGTTTNVPHTCMLKINNTNLTLTKRHKRSLSLSLTVWEHECLCLAFGLVDWFFGCLHKLVCVSLNGAALCLWISVCARVCDSSSLEGYLDVHTRTVKTNMKIIVDTTSFANTYQHWSVIVV